MDAEGWLALLYGGWAVLAVICIWLAVAWAVWSWGSIAGVILTVLAIIFLMLGIGWAMFLAFGEDQ